MKNSLARVCFLVLGIFLAAVIYEVVTLSSDDCAYCKNYIENELKSQYETGYKEYDAYIEAQFLKGEHVHISDVMSRKGLFEKYGATTVTYMTSELSCSIADYQSVLKYSDKYGLDPDDFSLNLDLKFKNIYITPFKTVHMNVGFDESVKYGDETIWYGRKADYEIILKNINDEWEITYMNWHNVKRLESTEKEYADGQFTGEIEEYSSVSSVEDKKDKIMMKRIKAVILSVIAIVVVCAAVFAVYIFSNRYYEDDYFGKVSLPGEHFVYRDLISACDTPVNYGIMSYDPEQEIGGKYWTKVDYEGFSVLFNPDTPIPSDLDHMKSCRVYSSEYKFGRYNIGVGSTREEVDKAYEKSYKAGKDRTCKEENRMNFKDHFTQVSYFFDENDIVNEIWFYMSYY